MKQLFQKKIYTTVSILILLVFVTAPVFSIGGGSQYKEGIFKDVLPSEAAADISRADQGMDDGAIRSRYVRVDLKRFFKDTGNSIREAYEPGKIKTVKLNLFYDTDLLVRIDKTSRDNSGTITFTGVGAKSGSGKVMLTANDDT